MKEHIYFIQGMHCASCELLIEKELLKLEGIKSVEASVKRGEVLVEYEGERPSAEKLNRIFEKQRYIFSDQPFTDRNKFKALDALKVVGIALFVIVVFIGLNRLGLAGLLNVNSSSSLPAFFVFGLLAGISSCAALVGGIVLSMSKQWSGQSFKPHLLFNLGRIISYILFGALLGVLGSKLRFSLDFTSILVIVVSLLMIVLALQMLGIRALQKFQFTTPKFITRYIANEQNFQGQYLPFLMGAFTFFLPCGFTITAQGLALISGSMLQGALIMFFFALGTLPMLILIGFSSLGFLSVPHLSQQFLKVAGILLLFFALYNINSQLNVLGLPSLNRAKTSGITSAIAINGEQIIKMEASASGYKPNYFKVKVGIPVRWEIKDVGTSGCTNAIIAKGLLNEIIDLTPGQTIIKEFTPQKVGKYKFSCWMGMISGVIEVVN